MAEKSKTLNWQVLGSHGCSLDFQEYQISLPDGGKRQEETLFDVFGLANDTHYYFLLLSCRTHYNRFMRHPKLMTKAPDTDCFWTQMLLSWCVSLIKSYGDIPNSVYSYFSRPTPKHVRQVLSALASELVNQMVSCWSVLTGHRVKPSRPALGVQSLKRAHHQTQFGIPF